MQRQLLPEGHLLLQLSLHILLFPIQLLELFCVAGILLHLPVQLAAAVLQLGDAGFTDGQLAAGGLLFPAAPGGTGILFFLLSGSRGGLFLLRLGGPVLGKAHGIVIDGTVGQLPDPRGEAIDEIPVVGHEQQGTVEGLHRLLDPLP